MAIERQDIKTRRSQYGIRNRKLLSMPKISPLTLKACIGCGLYHDEEVARGAAGVTARQTMPRNAKRHSLLDPRWNIHRECFFALDLAVPVTLRTGLVNQLSPSSAPWTGGDLLEGHAHILAGRHALAGAATGIATLWLSAWLCSRAMASWTGLPSCEPNTFFAPRRNAFERNLDHEFEIFAARRACVSSTKKAVEEPLTAKAEIKSQATEDLIEIDSAK
jgi:hypothetical protein